MTEAVVTETPAAVSVASAAAVADTASRDTKIEAVADAGVKTPEQLAADKTAADEAVATADKAVLDAAAQKLGKPADQLTDAEKEAARKDAKDAEGNKAKTGAPETYEAFKLPDGFEADEVLQTEFRSTAKELNLSQEHAQKLVDFQTANMLKAAKAQQTAWDNTVKGWVDAAKADPEVGGAKWEESLGRAGRALNEFGDKALLEALSTTGTGNRVEFLRFFNKVGEAIGEDKLHFGKAADAGPASLAELMYPSMKPK